MPEGCESTAHIGSLPPPDRSVFLFGTGPRSSAMRRHCIALFMASSAFLVCILPGAALARIKLITLPVRQRVEIHLDNPNATLVEEERIVPLVKGVNQADFSWANTQIDPNTILFRVLPPAADAEKPAAEEAPPMDIKVLSVSYPPNENAL